MNSICLHNGIVLTGFAAMEQCAILAEDGIITDVFSQKRFERKHFSAGTKIIDVNKAIIAPGFIDTHIHGFAGFGTEDNSPESIIGMSRFLVQHGVTAFNPTVYPAEPAAMLHTVKEVSSAIGKEDGAQIMGLHLEGPFLSPERLGVMKANTVHEVDLDLMEELWKASGGKIVNMTVAPELKGMRELALLCLKKGIVLQAGHTNARYENMVEGMQASILHSTHLFNAMSRMEHRNPNAVGAILIHPEMSCEIIADGFHIHPDLYKILLRDKPIDRIILVTDALKPTEQAEGPFFANVEEVTFRDGLFRRKSDDVIAGSVLNMIHGIKNLVSYGFSLENAVKTATSNPARLMRYRNKGAIIPGQDADLTVFSRNFKVMVVLSKGIIKKNLFE
jgi:N-acetylglucosamine-6-phosphate deacetylase